MWGMHEGMGWWMWWGVLWTALLWAVLIGGIAWLVSRLSKSEDEGGDPLRIAQARYARGEIGDEEFQRIRQNLRATR